MSAFFTLHADLPREGPGDAESLAWAVGLAGVAQDARILDGGCGPGADIAGLLVAAPGGQILAVDRHPPFVERTRAAWAQEPRVTARQGDMADADGPFDFIWVAGALYFLGIEAGLRTMRDKLAPGGALAFSELVWLVDDPNPELRAENEAEYPQMAGMEVLNQRIEAAGYTLLGQQVLSDAAWEAYYTPMEARVAKLRPGADAALTKVLDEGQAEINLWRAHRRRFGYALSVVRPR